MFVKNSRKSHYRPTDVVRTFKSNEQTVSSSNELHLRFISVICAPPCPRQIKSGGARAPLCPMAPALMIPAHGVLILRTCPSRSGPDCRKESLLRLHKSARACFTGEFSADEVPSCGRHAPTAVVQYLTSQHNVHLTLLLTYTLPPQCLFYSR